MARGGGLEGVCALTQKAALLAIQARPLPNGAPGPLGDQLLSWPRKGGGVLHSIVDILAAEDRPANLQPLFEELAVQLSKLWVCGGHCSENGQMMSCQLGDR